MKLNETHLEKIKHLFCSPSIFDIHYLNIDKSSNSELSNYFYEVASINYLGKFKCWHSFSDINFNSMVTCFQSIDDCSWYCSNIRSNNVNTIKFAMNECIRFNEMQGINKFYCVVPQEIQQTHSNMILTEDNKIRYEWVDEYTVPQKTRCIYNQAWQILYSRTLPEKDTTIRMYFLKKEFRLSLKTAGNI